MSALSAGAISAPARVASTAPLRRRRQAARAARRSVAANASSASSVLIAGATTPTGRLVASLAVRTFGGDNVTLVVSQDKQSDYWPDDMPDDVVEQRMFATAQELIKATLVDPRDAGDAMKAATNVIFAAEWGATQNELAEALLARAEGEKLRRVVMLSRVGVNRRDKVPFEKQNEPPKQMQKNALGLTLPTGGPTGQPGSLDGFALAEATLAKAAANGGWTAHIVRSGELRGNGPLLLADLSARLVDNLYDVKYQDLYWKLGDQGQGYTKRLNLAATLLRAATRAEAPPADVAALSVVCENNDPFGLLGEKTLTDPTDVERRKGYDMAKGRAPPPIADELIDQGLASV